MFDKIFVNLKVIFYILVVDLVVVVVVVKNKDLGNVLIFCFEFMGLGLFVLCRGVVVMGL